MEEEKHIPVLLNEIIKLMRCHSGGLYIDGTAGYGGHSEAILEASNPSGRLIGIDRDSSALLYTKKRLERFTGRFELIKGSFADLDTLRPQGVEGADGIVLDLGVSFPQLLIAERGFSYRLDGGLDMRMNTEQELTAEIIVNEYEEKELADIIYYYGDDRKSRRIASRIVEERKKNRILTTGELSRIVCSATGRSADGVHPARRTFQGLRIAVNAELDQLKMILEKAPSLLKPQGVICVISYHSLEDRIVKTIFKENDKKSLKILTKKPVYPEDEEVKRNPQSRSAKLRAAERL